MGVLKGIGYCIAAILVLSAITVAGLILSAIVSVAGVLLLAAGAIGLTALCIKEYCESVSNR
jgi:hypothetical protein